MGVEYCHGLAVADLNWMPNSDNEFENVEQRVSDVLLKWHLIDGCIEKRTGTQRMSRRDSESKDAKWEPENQKLRTGVPKIFEKERRLDWRPREDEESVSKIAGKDFEYHDKPRSPGISWMYMLLGPNFKVFQDPYGLTEVTKVKPFQCLACQRTLDEISDPWMPSMIDFFEICQSVCDCGGDVEPALLKAKSSSKENPAPDVLLWRAALIMDFGKCHPKTVVWSGRLQSGEFCKELERAFGTELVQFSAWR